MYSRSIKSSESRIEIADAPRVSSFMNWPKRSTMKRLPKAGPALDRKSYTTLFRSHVFALDKVEREQDRDCRRAQGQQLHELAEAIDDEEIAEGRAGIHLAVHHQDHGDDDDGDAKPGDHPCVILL